MPKSIKQMIELSGLNKLSVCRVMFSGFRSKCTYPNSCSTLNLSINCMPIYITDCIENILDPSLGISSLNIGPSLDMMRKKWPSVVNPEAMYLGNPVVFIFLRMSDSIVTLMRPNKSRVVCRLLKFTYNFDDNFNFVLQIQANESSSAATTVENILHLIALMKQVWNVILFTLKNERNCLHFIMRHD